METVFAVVLGIATLVGGVAAADQLLRNRRGRLSPVSTLPDEDSAPRFPHWRDYEGLFAVAEFDVAFLSIWSARPSESGIRSSDIQVETKGGLFELPPEFLPRAPLPAGVTDGLCCRVSSYHRVSEGPFVVTLSQTRYGDYVASGEHLDDPIPSEPHLSYRAKFGQIVLDPGETLSPFPLTNICGNGIFLRTRDECLVAVQHSENSQVYPSRWTFSASGVMQWSENPHPATAIILKTRQELGHNVNVDELRLAAFGVDARKLFFQFCWEERLDIDCDALKLPADVTWTAIPLDPAEVVLQLLTRLWEPSAEAMLLGIAIEKFGAESVVSALEDRSAEWHRRTMKDEWDMRASQPGHLSDMSTRYPRAELEAESTVYVEWVVAHLRTIVAGKDVLEVGAGTGRITERLAEVAARLTVVELSERMITRNKSRLGDTSKRVDYRCQFGHEYTGRHDVAVALLVLTHNNAELFEQMIEMLCATADVVVTCDDVSTRESGPHTFLRRQEDIMTAFAKRGFGLSLSSKHQLFDDKLVLQVFERHTSPR